MNITNTINNFLKIYWFLHSYTLRYYIFYFLFLLIIINKPAKSQIVNAGGKIDMSFGHIYNSNLQDNKMKLGFGFGIFGQYLINPSMAIQPELNYIQKGFVSYQSYIIDTAKISVKNKFKLNYINCPLLLKIALAEDFKFYLIAGPYIEFRWSARAMGTEKFETDTMVDVMAFNNEIKKFINKKDFGIALGSGFSIPIERYHGVLFFEFRYDMGLSVATFNKDAYLEANRREANETINYNTTFKKGAFTINAGMVYIIY